MSGTELFVVGLLAFIFASLPLVFWLEVSTRRRARAAIVRAGGVPAGAWQVPVVLCTHGWRSHFFEGTGILFAHEGTIGLAHRRLRTLWRGSFTPSGAPFEVLRLEPATTLIEGVAVACNLPGLSISVDGKPSLWLATDAGPWNVGGEERAIDLARALVARGLRASDRVDVTPTGATTAPLLTVGRRGPVELWRKPMIGLSLVALLFGCAGMYRAWLRDQGADYVPPKALVLLTLVPLTMAVYALLRAVRRRYAEAALFDDRVVITRESALTVAWKDVGGYRDDSADHVQLVSNDGSAPADLTIPTATEAERTAVLAFLDQRGLART